MIAVVAHSARNREANMCGVTKFIDRVYGTCVVHSRMVGELYTGVTRKKQVTKRSAEREIQYV